MEDFNIIDELKKLSRRVDTLQKSVDLLSEDRTILEDLLGRITSVGEILQANRQHQDLKTKDIKADIQDVQNTVEKTANEMQNVVQENVGALVTEVANKKVILKKKEHWWNKFKRK
jgi:hypothetical protein